MKLREKYGLFIDGEFVDAGDGAVLESFNPATGEKLATIAVLQKMMLIGLLKSLERLLRVLSTLL